MLTNLRHFLELIRFSHTLFALPFALLAALLAWAAPGALPWRWRELAGILLCMVTARSVAMACNRLADRRIDAANPRTAGRHLPAGILSVPAVGLFAALCGVAFVASTLLFLPNRLPFYLALPVLAFLVSYSFAKRFTPLAHFWLGAALALAPMAAWIAIRGEVILSHPMDLLPAVLLAGAVLAWVAGFDILYACQDVEFDRQAGFHSVPARLGVPGALQLAAACHGVTVLFLALLSWVDPSLDWIFGLGVAGVAGLLVYEHALVRPDDLERVNRAFFQVNAIISLGLLAVGSLDLWLGTVVRCFGVSVFR
jgi:4-hydroxybenzoate polyprenyltransferase